MVALPLDYCIDSTEVTQGQYQTWLDTKPSTSGQISACSGNTSFAPSKNWTPASSPNYPVVGVDWCDAYAYCFGVGKRLWEDSCVGMSGSPNGCHVRGGAFDQGGNYLPCGGDYNWAGVWAFGDVGFRCCS